VPNSSTDDCAADFLSLVAGPTVELLLVVLRLRGNSDRVLETLGINEPPSSCEVEPWPESLSETEGKDSVDVGMEVDSGRPVR
jgi:hypothetical protein